MDRYTLMVSKLTQLQDEWEPKRFDIVWYDNQAWHITSKDPLCYYLRADKQNDLFASKIEKGLLIYKPSLEALIEMLEYNGDWHFIGSGKGIHGKSNYYQVKQLANKPYKVFGSNIPQEALLKLVAYERWGLIWSDEKKTWEE